MEDVGARNVFTEDNMTKDQELANELFAKSIRLRDLSRTEWAKANEHLREMGSCMNQLIETQVELATVLKRINK